MPKNNLTIAFFVNIPRFEDNKYIMGFTRAVYYPMELIRERVSMAYDVLPEKVHILKPDGTEVNYEKTIGENDILPMMELNAKLS